MSTTFVTLLWITVWLVCIVPSFLLGARLTNTMHRPWESPLPFFMGLLGPFSVVALVAGGIVVGPFWLATKLSKKIDKNRSDKGYR